MFAIILDFILLLIVGVTVFFAIKRGLVRTVIDAFSLIIAALLSLFICPIFKSVFEFSGEYSEVATYFIVFVISWIIVKIVSFILDKIISALPVIRAFNTIGGLILGILLGVFRISIYSIAVGGILAIGEKIGVEFIQNVSINDTVLLKFVYEYNPINLLVNFILK